MKVKNLVVTAPGNISYSRTTKYGKKICVVVDNHITQMFKKICFINHYLKGKHTWTVSVQSISNV